ncbi:MAG: SMI1/KNR4 family protein [Planctomycetes bacterium]|nr:SMI1/KNR4 family protein [Planctomycetota bacterium]
MMPDELVPSPRLVLARIQAKVARIPVEAAPHDPAMLRRLGKPHIESPLQLNPALTEAELLAFEAEYRVTLPDEYRLFLREVGDGGLGPGEGLFRLADAVDRSPSLDLGTPFPFSVRQYREDPDRFYDERSAELDQESDQAWPGVLCLAEPDGYNWAYLVITGEDRGMVWGYGPHNCGWTPACPSSDLDNKWAHDELRGFFRWYEDWLDDWLQQSAVGGGG